MSQPTVCAIVPTFNRAYFLGETLDSLLAQTHPLDQIIVIDDGSTDNTKEVVAAYGDKIMYLHKENGGKAAALNYAQKYCSCDYVWIADDDDLADERGLERLFSPIEKDPTLDIVMGRYWKFMDKKGKRKFGEVVGILEKEETSIKSVFFERMLTNFFAMLIRKAYIEKIGPWDETFIRGEDYDMALRLVRYGHVGYTKEIIFYYRDHLGVRGSKTVFHDGKDRDQVWVAYEKKAVEKIKDAILLEEFVPSKERKLWERQAYIRQGCWFFRCSLFEEGFSSFTQALELAPDQPLSSEELKIARRVSLYIVLWRTCIQDARFLTRLRSLRLSATNGRDLVISLCRLPMRKTFISPLFLRDRKTFLQSTQSLFYVLGGFAFFPAFFLALFWDIKTRLRQRKARVSTRKYPKGSR